MLYKYPTFVKVMLCEWRTVEPQGQAIWNYVFLDTDINQQLQIFKSKLFTANWAQLFFLYLGTATYCGW